MTLRLTRDVLWSGTVADAPLPDRIDAAARSGYASLSLGVHDVGWARAGRAHEVLARARDRGVAPSIFDCAVDWCPHRPPTRPFPLADLSVDDVVRVGTAFEIDLLVATAPLPTDLSLASMAERFAQLADRVAALGWDVAFEFTPRSPVSDLAPAWELVSTADRPNAGLVLDSWHFFRGTADFDTLERIPGDRIMAVQLSDGDESFEENLLADTFRHRRLPGDGVFDLPRLVRALDAIGGLHRVGPEVLSTSLAERPAVDAAMAAADSVDALAART